MSGGKTRALVGLVQPKRLLKRPLKSAARVFVTQPGFAAATVFTLSLGIGATAAIFSVVYGVLLKPLPYPRSDELIALANRLRLQE